MAENELKKISKIYIKYEEPIDGVEGEDAIIYLPIDQVDGLTQTLSWDVYDDTNEQEG